MWLSLCIKLKLKLKPNCLESFSYVGLHHCLLEVVIYLHYEVISRLEGNNSGSTRRESVLSTWVWDWHDARAMLTFIQCGKTETNCMLPRAAVDWLRLRSIIASAAQSHTWLNQEATLKWFAPNRSLFQWSGAEIPFCVKQQKSGMIARSTV
jgi:hypothetical protein